MSHLKTYIVEDSLVIRENLIATLEELAPIKVIGVAEDESIAVEWLRQPGVAVDLVIIDIFLKTGSGLGVIQAGAELSDAPKLVVLTNYATQDMRRKCFQLGADEVFDKSHDIDGLIQYCRLLSADAKG
jgi:DNA-binding NarL/FixJ family response regulator